MGFHGSVRSLGGFGIQDAYRVVVDGICGWRWRGIFVPLDSVS